MSSERGAGTVHGLFGRVAEASEIVCPSSLAPAVWEVSDCELEYRTTSRRLRDWASTAGPEPGISYNSLIELATVCPRGNGRSRNSLAPYTASKERRATAGSRIQFRAYGLLQPGSGKASREASSSVAKWVLDVVRAGLCLL